MSLQTLQGLAVRYPTNINTLSGQLWWRSQFSGKPNEDYDSMYWDQLGAASRLHYQATFEKCDTTGTKCEEVIQHPASIIYAPRFISGAASGSGSSPALHYHFNTLICSGVDRYTWQVLPVDQALTYLPRIVQAASKIHIRSVQHLDWASGGCPHQTWIDDIFFGTVTKTGQNTYVLMQGGPGPYVDDPAHWDLLFSKITSVPSALER